MLVKSKMFTPCIFFVYKFYRFHKIQTTILEILNSKYFIMKKITFLILLIMAGYLNAQNGPVDFESSGIGDSWTWTVDQNDSNPALEIVDNPKTDGANTSAKVAKFTAKAAGNPWALVISDDIGSFTFDENNSIVKLMVRKDIATDVGVKFEGAGGVAKEVKVANSVINGDWEELTFDFKTEIGVTYNKLVIIPDFLARSQDNIVYFDNLSFSAQPEDTVNYNLEPIDFEDDGFGANFSWTVDQNDSNPALEIVDNPKTDGANTSAKVAKFTAKAAGNPWALVISDDIGSFTFDENNSIVKLMVRKDIATDVGVKFEGAGGVAKEVKVANSVINGDWEELTFDFKTEIGVTYNKLVIIPDFLARSQDNIVYFDNLSFSAQPEDTVNYNLEPIDFEDDGFGANFSWTVDQNDSNPALEIVDNPKTDGANTSAKVAKFTAKAAGNPWALVISDDIGSFTFDDTNSIVKIMVRKDVATDVGIKFEGAGGAAKEIKVANSVTNGDWEELTFDFKEVIGVTYNKLVIIPDFLARSQDNIVYFDNLTFNAQPDDNTGSDTSNLVTVDETKEWKGYMSVTNPSGANDGFADFWEFDKLKSSFNSGNIVLQPNFSTYSAALTGDNAARAYWTNSSDGGVTAGPLGVKMMQATSFVEPGATFNGKDLTFQGTINANTLSSDYTAKFFIKALDPNNGYSDVFNGEKIMDLPSSGDFSVSATADELATGLIIQYGFEIIGLNANPDDESALGSVIIEPNATLSTETIQQVFVNAYPNPTKSNWTIHTGNAQVEAIEVFNLLGKKVFVPTTINTKTTIHSSNLSSGIYLAKIKTDKGQTTIKLIKE